MTAHEHSHEHEHHHEHEHVHEHEHEHHHEHEHENRLPLGSSGFIDFTTHEEASVCSAKGMISGGVGLAEERMHAALEALGAWVDGQGGIIGHIKCSLSAETIVGLSITYDEVQTKRQEADAVGLSFAAIVFGIAPEDLRDKAKELLDPIVA